jgi:hypothetical protein
MTDQVYANGREISCKAGDGKSISAFPDVCFSPPTPPPSGVPIPYPNSGYDSDTTEGSKTVMISGQEVMLRDKSYYKRSTGDEAATPGLKKGVITGKIQGKVYFASWSMDVMIEGENVVRHMDLTTHNHGSNPPNTPPQMHQDDFDAFNASQGKICDDQQEKAKTACKDSEPHPSGKGMSCSNDCKSAKACVLKPKGEDKKFCCNPETTGHHLVEVHCFSPSGQRGKPLGGFEKYNQNKAPCACASTARNTGTHGIMHKVQGMMEGAYKSRGTVLGTWQGAGALLAKGGTERAPAISHWNYGEARDAGVLSHKTAFPHCNAACTKEQLDEYHKSCGIDETTALRSDPGVETRSAGDLPPEGKKLVDEAVEAAKNWTSEAGSV